MEAIDLATVSVPLPWQSDVWRQFHEQISSERLPHALLLTGIEYTGKNRLAMALARLLLCQQPVAGHNCGSCHACSMSRVGSHGDFRWLEPEGKSRMIKVDQIREVVDFGQKTANLGQRKVIVFSPAENMNPNAANALLKSLEEPTPETYMILVSHRQSGLPATVRSRCQQLKLAVPTEEQSLAWLDLLTAKHERSVELLNAADGRPLLAEKIYQDASLETFVAIPAALESLHRGGAAVPAVVSLLSQVTTEEALAHLGTYLQRVIRREGQGGEMGAQARTSYLLLDEVHRLQAAVDSGANPNVALLFESLLARFHKELGGC
ncbi:MAG: DNA polymerase III subunit delta' [Halioglobus sp.]